VKQKPTAPSENASHFSSNTGKSSEVNVVQSTMVEKTSKGKKKGTGKNKVDPL